MYSAPAGKSLNKRPKLKNNKLMCSSFLYRRISFLQLQSSFGIHVYSIPNEFPHGLKESQFSGF